MNKLNFKTEYITCAAIWFNDGIIRPYQQAKNIAIGIVICGHRHNYCFGPISEIYPDGSYKQMKHVQGFITSKDRFVDRLEASNIAMESGQVITPKFYQLYSEDIY